MMEGTCVMETSGEMRFAATQDAGVLLRRVMAMVAELEGLGVQAAVTVLLRVGELRVGEDSTRLSNCSPTIAETGMCARDAASMSSYGGSTHLSTPARSIVGSTLLGGAVSRASGNGQDAEGGKDFLAGAATTGAQAGIDWSGLVGTEAGAWVTSLEAGHVSWRKTPKELRMRLGAWVIQQLERPTQMGFDLVRPRWMPPASNMTLLFGMSWHDLVTAVKRTEG